ncbi:Arm DNA-binding domain-containing protein [Leptolyngbya sp. AN03gr2]|uniref:Arm DNA-binding domain-containing protein n=1 Tax=unclassified Leptolyngbya TaxID=2650499 RepID=UPI003D3148A0
MYSQANSGKSFKGSVSVEVFQGRLRLRLPRQLFGGKQKYLTLGLSDTDVNRRMAEAKAKLIESDIALERFDYTLEKYGKPKAPTLTVVEAVKPKAKPEVDLAQLWERYKEVRSKKVSETTMKLNYARVTGHIQKLPTVELEDAIAIRDHLLENNSGYTAHRIWVQFNACCKWALRSKLIPENPFAEMREDFRHSDTEQLKDIDSFSKEEMETVIAAFENHRHFKHYAPFVKFLFWTGARTSEAVGLQWKHITPDFQHIIFSEAVVNVSSKGIRKCTKTKRARKFPLFSLPKLIELLQSIKPADCDPESPVFTSVTGKLINSHSFNANVWKGCKNHGKRFDGIVTKLAKEGKIDHYRPQYQTRHTFITLQIEAGKSPTTIARWVGNRANVIEKHYMGDLSHLGAAEI